MAAYLCTIIVCSLINVRDLHIFGLVMTFSLFFPINNVVLGTPTRQIYTYIYTKYIYVLGTAKVSRIGYS